MGCLDEAIERSDGPKRTQPIHASTLSANRTRAWAGDAELTYLNWPRAGAGAFVTKLTFKTNPKVQ